MDNQDLLRLLASWALVHETADEGWKAAVQRGTNHETGAMSDGPDAFVVGLAAMVEERKQQLKAELARGQGLSAPLDDTAAHMDALRFEVAELRGRLESMQASLDALLLKTDRADSRDV